MSDKGGDSPEIGMPKIFVTGRQEHSGDVFKKTEERVAKFLSPGSNIIQGLAGLEQGVKKVLKDEVRPLTANEAHALLSSYGVHIDDINKAYLIYQALRAKGEIANIPVKNRQICFVKTNHEVSVLTDMARNMDVPPDEFQRLLNLCLEN